MKITLISDTHGQHERLGILRGDVLIHCGDMFNLGDQDQDHLRRIDAWFGRAKLLRPAEPPKGSSWAFLVLPKQASMKLPTRGMTTVEGSINGHPFQATLEPDGQKSHWLKVNKKMREAASAEVGDVVPLEIKPVAKQPETRIPEDLRTALAAAPEARAVWSDITPVARRDWIHWIVSARRSDTRAPRIGNACEMLAAGKRRVCCFDRSGFYSKSFSAPKAAE